MSARPEAEFYSPSASGPHLGEVYTTAVRTQLHTEALSTRLRDVEAKLKTQLSTEGGAAEREERLKKLEADHREIRREQMAKSGAMLTQNERLVTAIERLNAEVKELRNESNKMNNEMNRNYKMTGQVAGQLTELQAHLHDQWPERFEAVPEVARKMAQVLMSMDTSTASTIDDASAMLANLSLAKVAPVTPSKTNPLVDQKE
jgi:uncharacterized coiled-coil DUF342 family protein